MLMPVIHEQTRLSALQSLRSKRRLLTPRRVSGLLGMDLGEVYSRAKDGQIPFVKVNGALFAHPRQLREWLNSIEGSQEGRLFLVSSHRPFVPRMVVVPRPAIKPVDAVAA